MFENLINKKASKNKKKQNDIKFSKKIFTADFPKEITHKTQYGNSTKSMACYFSQWQLIPYLRLSEMLNEYGNMPLSQASLARFNKEAYCRLEEFENIAKRVALVS